jgi:hypothetical protein
MTEKRHAPRGPIKARGEDPMKATDPMRPRCTATNRQGNRCGKSPIPGGAVCRMHGGAAPQVKQKAQERLAAYQDRAIDRLFQLVEQTSFPSTAFAAVRDVLDRTMGKPAESVAVAHSGGIKIIHELPE